MSTSVTTVKPASSTGVFLTAEWRQLAMLNYVIDPAILRPLVPKHTELDEWQGQTLVSIVGFMFNNTRVRGISLPCHGSFEEVNLRFYVRRRADDGWRRGVVFVKELVDRRVVATVARLVYGENYQLARMGHRFEIDETCGRQRVSYQWRHRGAGYRMQVATEGPPQCAAPGSQEEFITEHYWGYSGGAGRATIEYQVEHPRWHVWSAAEAHFEGDVTQLYGPQFVSALTAPPCSALLADGSPVTVRRGVKLTGD